MQSAKVNTTPAPKAVDNTDWLKTIAIILVTVDHIGYFFIENEQWWSVFGRLAAPMFFFFLGYAQTRIVPLSWIWLGVILTLLDSSNNEWTWMAPNILFSLALIRIARPYVQIFVQRRGWIAIVLIVSALVAILPVATNIVDYGAEGWLWAMFGFCQRLYVDSRLATDVGVTAQSPVPSPHAMTENVGLMRLLTCLVAAIVYVWQEQIEFLFSQLHFITLVLGVGVLSLSLCLFRRGPSRVQLSEPISSVLRFIGRRTLEIYAISLIGFELTIMLWPDLAP